MKVNRRHFFGILFDCVLFEWASQAKITDEHGSGRFTLSLQDLADTFSFVVDFYKHHRKLMDIPIDQFLTRNAFHTVAGLVDYIESLGEKGTFEIFPGTVELREEALSFISSSSYKQEFMPISKPVRSATEGDLSPGGKIKDRDRDRDRNSLGFLEVPNHGWGGDSFSFHHNFHAGAVSDTDPDDEYSIVIPGLSKTDIQTFLWEYAYLPEDYQDDIATLIRYLRRDEWMISGSKGSIVTFDWGLEGVQKFSREYNQRKIHKVQVREQEEIKRSTEATQRQQDEWSKQQETIKEKELHRRMRKTDEFIWSMHKVSNSSFAAEIYTHQSNLDLTLTGSTKDITMLGLQEALKHFHYEDVTLATNHCQTTVQCLSFVDPRSGTTCHLTLNDPVSIYRSRLIHAYAQIDSRFGPVLVALKQLAVQRHLVPPSLRSDRYHHHHHHHHHHRDFPLGGYALTLMLITFLQTENPPLLPKLQQNPSEDDRPLKDTIVQGVDCSFDTDWKYYQGLGVKNSKSVAELLIEFCRFFGYVFDFESKEVNPRLGAFRWRAGTELGKKVFQSVEMTRTPSGNHSAHFVDMTKKIPPASMTIGDASVTFHVVDPFMNMNIASSCRGEAVHAVRLCFQDAYEALQEGNMNHVFS
ncbi:hypothetical protein BGZ83_011177 [Gryganskiella cystojenkinii]|nr:hypothetical protein BGZ83_011177 [Gryganskiella cystojenkinii]